MLFEYLNVVAGDQVVFAGTEQGGTMTDGYFVSDDPLPPSFSSKEQPSDRLHLVGCLGWQDHQVHGR
jgi:hypothetical protein